MSVPSDSIDVEAGLRRDHQHRIALTVCRYALALIVTAICAVALRCDPAADADGHYWRGRAIGCEKGSGL